MHKFLRKYQTFRSKWKERIDWLQIVRRYPKPQCALGHSTGVCQDGLRPRRWALPAGAGLVSDWRFLSLLPPSSESLIFSPFLNQVRISRHYQSQCHKMTLSNNLSLGWKTVWTWLLVSVTVSHTAKSISVHCLLASLQDLIHILIHSHFRHPPKFGHCSQSPLPLCRIEF